MKLTTYTIVKKKDAFAVIDNNTGEFEYTYVNCGVCVLPIITKFKSLREAEDWVKDNTWIPLT
jgi:hypothetical protein